MISSRGGRADTVKPKKRKKRKENLEKDLLQ
jgi:hypothetical protein